MKKILFLFFTLYYNICFSQIVKEQMPGFPVVTTPTSFIPMGAAGNYVVAATAYNGFYIKINKTVFFSFNCSGEPNNTTNWCVIQTSLPFPVSSIYSSVCNSVYVGGKTNKAYASLFGSIVNVNFLARTASTPMELSVICIYQTD